MKRITLLLLLFFSMNSVAQYYVRAELHFLDGTKTFGLAYINTFNDKIKFKKNKDDKRISYNHKDVSRLILGRDTLKKEFRYKKTLSRRAPKLLELIIEDDNISLYAEIAEIRMYGLVGALLKVPNQFIYTYYIVKDNGNKAIYFGDTELTVHKRFKEITKKHLKGCEEVLVKVNNKKYKVKHAQEVVRHYNEKCTNSSISEN